MDAPVLRSVAPSNRLSVAIIGLGRMGAQGFGNGMPSHTDAVLAHPRLRLHVGVDTRSKARESFYVKTGIQSEASLSEPVDIAVIATPPETHAAVIESVLPLTRAVLCEKPLADTVSGCTRIVGACEKFHNPLLVGHQRRYEQRHILLRAFLKSGVLGRIITGDCRFPDLGNFLNNGCHAADTMRFLMGDETHFTITPRDGVFDARVVCERGLVSLSSYGNLEPGYLHVMYNDLIESLETGRPPSCSGADGLKAVEIALQAQEERDAA